MACDLFVSVTSSFRIFMYCLHSRLDPEPRANGPCSNYEKGFPSIAIASFSCSIGIRSSRPVLMKRWRVGASRPHIEIACSYTNGHPTWRTTDRSDTSRISGLMSSHSIPSLAAEFSANDAAITILTGHTGRQVQVFPTVHTAVFMGIRDPANNICSAVTRKAQESGMSCHCGFRADRKRFNLGPGNSHVPCRKLITGDVRH